MTSGLHQAGHQLISLAQIAGSFRGCEFCPGRYQQVSCFGASGCALAGADEARDADRRAQFPTDRPELPRRGKRAFEQAHGSPVVSQWFATQQRAVDPINLGSSPALAGMLYQGLSRSSEASSPFYLPDPSEFCGEQNSIERHLSAPVLGGEFAEQAAYVLQRLWRRASSSQRRGRPQRPDDPVHWIAKLVGDLQAAL